MLQNLIQTEAEKITFLGGVVNLILSFVKILGGIFFHSAGLIADGIHSLSDLISDVMVGVILKISGKKPDTDHPWGHGRFETMGTAILGAGLIYLSGTIAYQSIISLLNPEVIIPATWPALVAVIASILIKELLYHYTLRVGKKINSDLIIANAWHHRTDCFSSIAVLIGLIGAYLGFFWLDYVAAIAVAIVIFKMGFSFAYQSLRQLVDTALEPEEVQNLTNIAKSVAGVKSVHDFKTRGSGSQTILEMHIQVDPFISSSEGHQIGENVVLKLEKRAKEIDIAHVIYHIDTYDDRHEKHSDYINLPLRRDIKPVIDQALKALDISFYPYRITLHYHNKKVGVVMLYSEQEIEQIRNQGLNPAAITEKIETELRRAIELQDWLHGVKIAALLDS